MNVNGKIIIVTGAGSGIGRALVEKFVAEGARQVVAVDINAGNAQQTANDYGCVAMTADVSRDEDIKRVVEETESSIGPIDLFCSNAGVGMGLSEQSPDREWQMSWDINVMSHVYAARHLVPRMIERGGGYFLNTASAAGLLNQVGGAAYGVSKHAAVGFGEWLALTYAHQGIKVSMLCPQAVRTAILGPQPAGAERPKGQASFDGVLEPETVADACIEAVRQERFLVLPHPEVETYFQRKANDYDRWLSGMRRFRDRISGQA